MRSLGDEAIDSLVTLGRWKLDHSKCAIGKGHPGENALPAGGHAEPAKAFEILVENDFVAIGGLVLAEGDSVELSSDGLGNEKTTESIKSKVLGPAETAYL